MTLTLNPGFALLLAAAAMLAAPTRLRPWLLGAAALAALALSLAPDFGAYERFEQLGLEITPLRLDALSQVFALALAVLGLALAIASAARRDRIEDCALAACLGGAMSACYAGDLLSFAALFELAAFAGAALTFQGGGEAARRASLTMLSVHAAAGAMVVVGAGLHWGATGATRFDRLSLEEPGAVLVLLGLLVGLGAPPAHLWLKEAAARASPIGAAALLGALPAAALYGLARGFPGEPGVLLIGVWMILYPTPFAAIERHPLRLLGYAAVSLSGTALAAVGFGGPLALAGAAASAFAQTLALALAALVMGLERAPLWRRGGLMAWAGLLAALSLAGAPGAIGYAASSLVLDALAQGERLIWLTAAGAVAASLAHCGWRLQTLAIEPDGRARTPAFPSMLGVGVLAFFIIAIGVGPDWLYALLPPGEVIFDPFDPARLAARAQLLLGGGLALAVITAAGAYPRVRGARTPDLDLAAPTLVRLLVAAFDRMVTVSEFLRARAGAQMERAAEWVLRKTSRWAEPPEGADTWGPAWVLVLALVLALALFVL